MTAPTARIPAMDHAATEAANELEYAEVRIHRALRLKARAQAQLEAQQEKAKAASSTAAGKRAEEAVKAARQQLREANAAEREAKALQKEAEAWVKELQQLNEGFTSDYEKRLAETRRRFMQAHHGKVASKARGVAKRKTAKRKTAKKKR